MHLGVFPDKRTKWRWHLLGKNGQIVLTSQSYYSKWNAMRAAKKLARENNYEIRTK